MTGEWGVLLELSRALPAVAAVGVLPGWFWARVLWPAADGLERLAYSAALSVTLVPALALLLARLLGGGVTLPVALVSAGAVFAGGLAAYLRFGAGDTASKDSKALTTPLLGVPAAGYSTLVALAAACVVALPSMWGLYEGWRVAPLVALLVLLAGVSHLLGQLPRRDATTAGPTIERPAPRLLSASAVAHYGLLSVVLGLVLARGYLGPVRHDWPYARGVDIYEHAVMTEMMLSRGTTESFMLYPPGLHVLTALLSRLSGLAPLEVFAVLAPTLLLLTSLSCYALARRVWGPEAGVVAAFISGVILVGTFQHLSEARFPNLIGGQFLLTMTLAALVVLYFSPTVRGGLLLAVLGSSVVLYHQVASFTLAQVLFLVTVLLVPPLLVEERRKGITLLASFAALGLLAVIYAWDTYELGRLLGGLLFGEPEASRGGEAVGMALGTKLPYPFEHLLQTATQPVVWLGLLGALLVLVSGGRGSSDVLARVTLLFWGAFMFVGSQTALSSFPDRFERDLGVPLALLAAFAAISVLRSLVAARGLPARGFALLVALPVVVLVAYGAARNLQEAEGPAARNEDRAPPPRVVAAGEWLAENNTGGTILPNPYFGPTSARGMLAMGGYSGMQAYTEKRIRKARDLPPSGAEPLWDVLWATSHPASERTRRLITENDVRYVVLNKRFPGAGWLAYREHGELYRMVYENDVVVIFEPRYTD